MRSKKPAAKTRKMGSDSKALRRSSKTIDVKPNNPKDSFGVRKVSFSNLPAIVIAEMALGMTEGSPKYGRHNYRVVGVCASVYFDAALRHLFDWWEGQDIDPDSGLNHIVKGLTSLAVLRDGMLNGKLTDDRPPPVADSKWLSKFNRKTAEILDRFPNPKPPFTRNSVEVKRPRKAGKRK